jgi:uroporphyrinogen-III synthase
MVKGLAGIKVLLTRPDGQGDSLQQAIEEQGGECLHYPVMAILALTEETDKAIWERTKQAVINLDHYQQVIFISTNAVHFGMGWIEQYWPQLPLGFEWHAIGKATAQALSVAGVPCSYSDEQWLMNSEALLQQASLQHLEQGRVLIVRGVGGREYLTEQLQQRGARVDYAECYHRRLVARPEGELSALLQGELPDCLVINSGETLDYVCQLLGDEQFKTIPVVVPGYRVAKLAQQRGFSTIVTASNAGSDAMIKALQEIAQHQ